MIDRKPTLIHHFFNVAVAELIVAIPADAQDDDGGLVVPPLERRFMLLQEYDSRRVIDEPKQDNSSKAILATEPFLPLHNNVCNRAAHSG